MGEAYKRMRAASFVHQRHEPYQKLIDHNLFTLSRHTDIRRELTCRLTNTETELAVGSRCLVRSHDDGEYELLHGNIVVVAQLPREAKEEIEVFQRAAPALNGMLPCRVTRVGPLGSVSLEVDVGEEVDE